MFVILQSGQVQQMKKSSLRLTGALIETSLGSPMCLLMAQQLDKIIFEKDGDSRHVKLIGKLYDQVCWLFHSLF